MDFVSIKLVIEGRVGQILTSDGGNDCDGLTDLQRRLTISFIHKESIQRGQRGISAADRRFDAEKFGGGVQLC